MNPIPPDSLGAAPFGVAVSNSTPNRDGSHSVSVSPFSAWLPANQITEQGWYWMRNNAQHDYRDRVVFLTVEMVADLAQTMPLAKFQRVADPLL